MKGTDDSEEEYSAETNPDDPWSDRAGEPLVCPDCGEHVSIIYRPWSEYPARSAGFAIECACATGDRLRGQNTELLWEGWYVERVMETENNPERLIEDYSIEQFDAVDLIDEYAGGSDE